MKALRLSTLLVAACAGCTTILGISGDYTEQSTQGSGASTSSAGGGGATGEGGATSVGGAGGSGGDGGATGSGGTGGTMEQCSLPEDCTAPIKACEIHTCELATCGVADAPANTASNSQVYGDCRQMLCDSQGGLTAMNDPNDIYDDGNECTSDYCDMGVSVSDPEVIGATCSMGFCDGNGKCVGCLVTNQCPMGQLCASGLCVPMYCGSMMLESPETDVDCGGPACAPCVNGKICAVETDCQSGVCSSGSCAAPTCMDGVKNGDETGVDCGGVGCSKCGVNQGCSLPSDCNSQVCIAGVCQMATCTDGVNNGSESGVDCGGFCAPCPP